MVMRLCCLCSIVCINEFKLLQNCLGDYNEVYQILIKYFDPQILTERIKSKSSEGTVICQNCWLHLNGFHNFQKTILKIKNILDQRAQLTVTEVEENVPTVISDDYNVSKELKQTSSSSITYELQPTILKLETPLEQTFMQRSPLHIKDEEQHGLAVFKSDCNIANTEFKKLKNLSLVVNTATTIQNESYFVTEKHSANESLKEDQQSKKDFKDSNVEDSVKGIACTSLNIASSETTKLHANCLPTEENQKFKCVICGKMYSGKSNLNRHLLTHSEPKTVFECEKCGRAYVHKTLLREHMKYHSNTEQHCDECGKILANHKSLKYHKKSCHNSEPIKFRCNECGKELANPNTLKKHKESYHSECIKKKFSCDKCGREFLKPCSVKYHKEICQNDGSMVYVCSICGKIFATESRLRKHRKNSHENVHGKNSKCPYCDKVFKRSKYLIEHIACHHTKKPLYECAHCPKSFYSNVGYRIHNKKIHQANHEENAIKKIDYTLVKNIAII